MNPVTGNIPPTGASFPIGALQLFESLAGTTWDWLGHARKVKLAISEDSVTDITELEIATAGLNGIKVTRVTKQEESRYGFDWMWFIGNRDQGYIRYAVQAKKIILNTSGSYNYRIRHKSGLQIVALKRFANCVGAIPLYCFYNNVDTSTAVRHWHCFQQPDVRQMGCTLVPLDAVEIVHKPGHRKDFTAIHQDQRAIPWRCLFHPSCVSALIHRRAVGSADYSTYQAPDDLTNPVPRDLPEFLLGDSPTVELDEVIRQLFLDDEGGDPSLRRRLALPARCLVIESEPA
ncbi:MAG: hypothetical protein OXC09_05625 [Truepera sp.]|nr:hypothetical protein [Truepera sp.]